MRLIRCKGLRITIGRALKNPWIQKKRPQEFVDLFDRVYAQGLVFDGKHITLSNRGISFDYVAYKNKMLLAYPESKMAINIVYQGDEISFDEADGKVNYTHKYTKPFDEKDEDIVGAYCVIKNDRGEYLTKMGLKEIDKHRKVAKTDYIWSAWFPEMVRKTVIKKACKNHFDDVFQKIEEMDNVNYDLDNPLSVDLKVKQEIDAIDTVQGLEDYYRQGKPTGDTLNLLAKRKAEINKGAQGE